MSLRSLASSFFLHAVILLLALFGVPMILTPEEPLFQPTVIAVDLQIAPVNNAPTRTPTPPKKPVPDAPKVTPPAPKPEPVQKPEPKPAPTPPEKKPEPKKEAPKKPEPKKEESQKEPPKKEEPKKEPQKDSEPTMDEILKNLAKEAPKAPSKPAEKGQKSESDVPFDPSMPLSQTVENAIRNQIMACWHYQGGAKNQDTLVAHIQVIFREDGSVIEARLKASDQMRYNTDSAFRSLVDSAMRATRNRDCVPLKGLPVESYKSWSKIELVFDPRDFW